MASENIYMIGISNRVREILKKQADSVIGRGRLQKRMVVLYYNMKAILDLRKPSHYVLDYQKIISGKRHFFIDEFYRANGFYGIGHVIRRYSGYRKKINACIEHGMYWGDYYLEFEAKNSGLNGMITFGKGRRSVLEKEADVPVYTIGPYINYAKCLLSEKEQDKLKKEWGDTLLIFPTHSVENLQADFDENSFLEWIESFRKEHRYQTVLICLYYKDILLGRDQKYKEKGYKIVTAGYLYDPLFLDRLNTFLELADYTLSNFVGTHLCYCVAKGKGHTIYNQEVSLNAFVSDEKTDYPQDSTGELERKLKDIFSDYEKVPLKRQEEIIDFWCGMGETKSRTELLEILESLESKRFGLR